MSVLAAGVGAATAGLGALGILRGQSWARRAYERSLAKAERSSVLRGWADALGVGMALVVKRLGQSLLAGTLVGVLLAGAAWVLVGPPAVVAVLLGAGGGAVAGRAQVTTDVKAAREGLSLAAVELAELISLALGGGLGVVAALDRGASELRGDGGSRLAAAARSRRSPWGAIESLGKAAGVSELVDLAQSIGAGVANQARTRELLLGWAQAKRQAQLEADEARAGAVVEAMTGPSAVILVGFLLLVGVAMASRLLPALGGQL